MIRVVVSQPWQIRPYHAEGPQDDRSSAPFVAPQGLDQTEQTPDHFCLLNAKDHDQKMLTPLVFSSNREYSEPSETDCGEPTPASSQIVENAARAMLPTALLCRRLCYDALPQFPNQFNEQEAPPLMPWTSLTSSVFPKLI